MPRRADVSVTAGPHEMRDLSRLSRMFADVSDANVSMNVSMTEGAPSSKRSPSPAADLTARFYEISQSARAADASDAPLRYSEACGDSLDAVDAWERLSPKNVRLAEERDSWTLLHCLHLDAIRPERVSRDEDTMLRREMSPRSALERLFEEDREVRLMQTVVDWLERCTSRQDAAIPPVGGAGGSLHWENALHAIQNGASLFDSNRRSDLITELDPDAPRRQKRSLHVLDRQDDDALCRRLFKELRCGRFEEAVSLCVDAGQAWRAIILQGWRPLDYPEPAESDAKFPSTGNASRDLWKWACARYLELPDENAHFKACLGVLSGRGEAVVPVCEDSREDLLWAHLRVQIELRVDARLRECGLGLGFDGPSDEFPPELSLDRLFDCVKSSCGRDVETPHREVQRYLILDRADALLARAASWVDAADPDLLRFLCHLVLVLRRIGKGSSPEAGDAVIEAYAERLIQNANGPVASTELVSFYASKLPRKTRVKLFSDFMWTLEATEDRRAAVDAGRRAGVDVQSAIEETVRRAIRLLKDRLLNVPVRNDSIFDDDGENRKEAVRRVIGCLEWLSFYKNHVFEAVSMGNAIIRILIFKWDVDSAAAVLSRLTEFYPSAVIAQNFESSSNFLREYFCLKAYLEAIDGYAAWYRQYTRGRPKSPEPLMPDCSFTDKVHREQINAKIATEREKWTAAGVHQADRIKRLLYNVLLFPEGWLVDDAGIPGTGVNYEAEEFIDRDKQLDSLRKMCIPEIVLLLIKVLQSGNVECHAEAVRLAELLASEKRKLYLLFPKHKLQEVLHKIGESSLYALENDRDPWGFGSNDR